jgi:hypothetical protein
MQYFDEAPCTNRTLIFRKEEIDKYQDFFKMNRNFQKKDLRGVIARFTQKYFGQGQKETCVAPTKGSKYDLFVSVDNEQTANDIVKYIRKTMSVARQKTKKRKGGHPRAQLCSGQT